MILRIPDAEAMLALGAELARASRAESSLVIYLHGNLGAGKTTLARGFLRGLGFLGAVKSPTYTLVEPYQCASHMLYHFDLYRLAAAEELEYLGMRDFLVPHSLWLVEWPERGRGILPAADVSIEIAYHDSHRRVQLTACSVAGERLLRRLPPALQSRSVAADNS